MNADTRPVALIPAYRPELTIIEIAGELLESGQFQAVVCVDDGSGQEYRPIFDMLERRGALVLRHFVNLGKGMALRTGINHIACTRPNALGVVTLDADGQHLAKDVKSVAETLQQHPAALIMGCRKIRPDAPFRSRFGNSLTKHIMNLCMGVRVSDTQTGLRGLPLQLAPHLLRLSPSGYDFETEMLVKLSGLGVRIKEVPIAAVYIDGNKSSHFRPLIDSIAIYFVFLRHAGNALVTAFLDYAVFATLLMRGNSLVTSLVAGRIVAGLFNYYVGKTFVFKSRRHAVRELFGYTLLVMALTTVSYYASSFLLNQTSLTPLISKLLVESTIFLASFALQRVYIFGSDAAKPAATDWDRYYANRTSRGSPTRKVTERLLLSTMVRHKTSPVLTITEFGGGDSCFFAAMRRRFPDAFYLVVDKSEQGIRKFLDTNKSRRCDALQADLLANPALPPADVVFSVGLIEHFDPPETAKIIESHFKAATPGGLVVITYPTPTILYRLIRAMAEGLGIWRFHDERPLSYSEVGSEMAKHGRIVHRQINWFIGLTQEIVVARSGLPRKEAG